MPNHHTLKTTIAMFEAVERGDKRFEVRNDDRAFQCGDKVTLRRGTDAETPWSAPQQAQAPALSSQRQTLDFTIGFVLRGGQYGIEPGYVAFQLVDCCNKKVEMAEEELRRTTAMVAKMHRDRK